MANETVASVAVHSWIDLHLGGWTFSVVYGSLGKVTSSHRTQLLKKEVPERLLPHTG